MDLELENKIKNIFRGLEEVDIINLEKQNLKNAFRNILIKEFDPPAYIVKIIMISFLKLKYFRSSGKVSWYSYFKFSDFYFKIRDYKFGTWTLEGLVGEGQMDTEFDKNSDIYRAALILRKRIKKASILFDKIFKRNLLENINNGKIKTYYLNSAYNKLLSIYRFFRHNVEESISNFEKFLEDNKDNPIKLEDVEDDGIEIELLGKKQIIKPMKMSIALEGFTNHDKIISNYSFALMSIFFSVLEFILEAFYLFGNRIDPFLKFKKRYWYEKFKIVFPIDINKTLKKIYDDLGQIKKKYRNPLIHGLTGDFNLLVHIPGSGLVPISYEFLTDNVAFDYNEISFQDSKKILTLFESFLNYLENEEPYNYYILFFKFEFPIPINEKDIEEIKNQMNSYEEFEQELLDRARYEDMVRNRDI